MLTVTVTEQVLVLVPLSTVRVNVAVEVRDAVVHVYAPSATPVKSAHVPPGAGDQLPSAGPFVMVYVRSVV